jgi:hypothetical protein
VRSIGDFGGLVKLFNGVGVSMFGILELRIRRNDILFHFEKIFKLGSVVKPVPEP